MVMPEVLYFWEVFPFVWVKRDFFSWKIPQKNNILVIRYANLYIPYSCNEGGGGFHLKRVFTYAQIFPTLSHFSILFSKEDDKSETGQYDHDTRDADFETK